MDQVVIMTDPYMILNMLAISSWQVYIGNTPYTHTYDTYNFLTFWCFSYS